MNPKTAIKKLRSLGWSDYKIANAVGVTQPTIWRMRQSDAATSFELGSALVELAKKEARKAAA